MASLQAFVALINEDPAFLGVDDDLGGVLDILPRLDADDAVGMQKNHAIGARRPVRG